MRRLKTTNESGATAVIVLVLATALFGMAGFVIDVGIVRQERRELQNGADAAALHLAQDCARGLCTNLDAKAKLYADANAIDGRALASATLVDANTVKVDTLTETGAGATSLTMQFAQFFGHSTSTVGAAIRDLTVDCNGETLRIMMFEEDRSFLHLAFDALGSICV